MHSGLRFQNLNKVPGCVKQGKVAEPLSAGTMMEITGERSVLRSEVFFFFLMQFFLVQSLTFTYMLHVHHSVRLRCGCFSNTSREHPERQELGLVFLFSLINN